MSVIIQIVEKKLSDHKFSRNDVTDYKNISKKPHTTSITKTQKYDIKTRIIIT